jgi:hypothetical protein
MTQMGQDVAIAEKTAIEDDTEICQWGLNLEEF